MEAARFVQQLAVAYSTRQLYPDPTTVPAFSQSVAALGELGNQGLVVHVTVDGFRAGSDPIEVEHGAATRLGQLLFARRVESLSLLRAPTPEEVAEFLVELDAEVDDDGLDLATRLALAGVSSFGLTIREVLEDRQEEEPEEEVDRHPDVEALFANHSVQRIADKVSSAATLSAATDEFLGLYLNAYSRLSENDPAGLERVVQTFVDAFFRLEATFQVPIFEAAIVRRTETALQCFLDQFSVDEFKELAAKVEDAVLPLLLDYAAAVADHVGAAHDPTELGGGEDLDDPRETIAISVGQHLAHFLEFDSPHALALANISGELTQLQTDPVEGPKVLAELLLVEDRPERLTRLLRVWAGRSARAIRGGSFELALKWLEVVSSRTDLDPRLVDEAYRQVVTDEVFDIITGQDVPGRAELLEALSQTASSRVLNSLAVEEDPGRRRVLIDVVADIARVDSRSIVGGLSDPRWYVVRNLATALGKSGRRAVAEPLSRLLQHDDHRVRIEAARALLPCMGDEVVDYLLGALTDEHVRVRATVTDLLKTLNDDVVVPALEAGLRDATGSVETRVAMIEALGARGGPIPQRILAELAGSRAGYSSAARTLRSAARKALRSSDA